MTSSIKSDDQIDYRKEEHLLPSKIGEIIWSFFYNRITGSKISLNRVTTWRKVGAAVEHRGLDSAEKANSLQQFLEIIASLCPPLLHGDITDDAISLANIYKILRAYYQFAPSEGTFLKLSNIKEVIIIIIIIVTADYHNTLRIYK